MSNNNRLWVVIPAAGIGKRMGVDIPKQYITVCDTAIIEHTVEKFTSRNDLQGILVALSNSDQHWSTLELSENNKITTVTGGEERYKSVYNALCSLKNKADDDDWILVHDAVRPCITTSEIDQFIADLDHLNGIGGILALPCFETMKKANTNHEIEETIDMLAKDSSSWQAKYNESQEELKICQFRIEEVEGSIETIKLQLVEKDKASEEISSELQQLYRESDDMSEELTSKIMSLETELDQSKNQVEKLTGEMTALETSHSVVVAGFEDEKNAVITQIYDLTAQVESTSTELNETKEAATLERMQLKTKVANLEDDLLQSKEEEERLIQSIKAMESDYEEALKRVQDEKSMAIQNLEKKM